MDKLRKGDIVEVITGSEAGKQGKILNFTKNKTYVVVENVNKRKKHAKRTQNQNGGILDINLPVHISNVLYFCEHCKKKTKVKIDILKDGKKVRVCKKCDREITTK